jgi:hypothetical protein
MAGENPQDDDRSRVGPATRPDARAMAADMPAVSPAVPGEDKVPSETFWMRPMGAGLALSLLLHLAAGYLFVHGVEVSRTLPGFTEEPVEVVMVSPEEAAAAKDPPPPPQEQAREEEAPPPPDEDKAEVVEEPEPAAAAPEPEPKPQADAEQEPEETAAEEQKPEQPPEQPPEQQPPETETLQEQPAAPPEGEAPAEQMRRVLQPVTEFGEEDSGNQELDGDGAREAQPLEDGARDKEPGSETEGAPEEETPAETADQTAEASPAETAGEAPEVAGDTADTASQEPPVAQETQEPAAVPAPAPEVLAAEASGEDGLAGEAAPGTPTGAGVVALPPQKPVDIAAIAARARGAPSGAALPGTLPPGVSVSGAGGTTSARQLFSHALSQDPRVRAAMRGMGHAARADLLCMTELRSQLRSGRPSYNPDLLPSFRLRTGNVLEPKRAAFRANGLWYELAFRCELNAEITRVETFSYRVGAPVPRVEWAERGFPAN